VSDAPDRIAEPAPAVTTVRKSVPPNVAAAVMKSLEKLPADRFESAKAFRDALADTHFTVAGFAGGDAAGRRGELVRGAEGHGPAVTTSAIAPNAGHRRSRAVPCHAHACHPVIRGAI
jgi:serine/threonine-protein kinase